MKEEVIGAQPRSQVPLSDWCVALKEYVTVCANLVPRVPRSPQGAVE